MSWRFFVLFIGIIVTITTILWGTLRVRPLITGDPMAAKEEAAILTGKQVSETSLARPSGSQRLSVTPAQASRLFTPVPLVTATATASAATPVPLVMATATASAAPSDAGKQGTILTLVTATPTPTADAVAGGGEDERIDQMGPIAMPTIAALPDGEGRPPVRLIIPVLDLDTPVQAMSWKTVRTKRKVRSVWEVVDFAAGHHINTAFPGEEGNVVLSGHNNIGGSVFRSVCVIGEPGVAFGIGDEMILVDDSDRSFTYEVNGWQRMEEANASIEERQENAQWMAPTDFPQLTLVTCWPPSSNTHRVVVTGVLTGMRLD